MDINKLWIIFMPLTFGFGGYGIFMQWRSQKHKVSFLDGLLGWLILVATGFVGEFFAHFLRPEAYQGIGDNPMMVVGLMYTIMFSFILCPLLWWSLRRRSKASDHRAL